MQDSEIDYSDIPRLDKTFLKKATMAWPPTKKQLTIRLDEDVLDWLKGHGKGYQTRINRILRVVMESQPPRTVERQTGGTALLRPTQDLYQIVRTALDCRISRSAVRSGKPSTSAVAPMIRSAGSLG